MSKIFVFFTFILLLTQASKCYALESFVPKTQLDFSFPNENWVETEHTQASILFENGLFKQWYTSKNGSLKIAYATSTNGISWSNVKLMNFLSIKDFHDSSLIKVNSNYELYLGTDFFGGKTRIAKITSSDSENFDINKIQTILTPEANWERNEVTSPATFYENGIYYLFYTGNGDGWRTGLAISSNGDTFNKCPTNPILWDNSVPKSLIKFSNTYYLFFHSSNGIEYMETDKLGCDSVWKNRTVALPYGYFPYVIRNGNELWMYYSTFEYGQWRMNLATSKLNEKDTSRKPIVLIPGMFSAWNKDAILHNQPIALSDWQLNPIVKEYDGFTGTLDNLGYRKNTDYFVFPYDWRKPVEESSNDLNSYITGLHLAQKPSLVGHSLGGLVGRVYAQKYGPSSIDKLVAVGTPHQGTALVYPAIEAGESDTRDEKMWLAEKLALQLYRSGLESDREIMNKNIPVLQDMLPTYNFLKMSGEEISLDKMTVRNKLLPGYNLTFSSLYDRLQAVVGETGSTLMGYAVSKQNIIDSLLNNYPDGRPTGPIYTPGDGTVISFSANTGNNITTLNMNHGELVYSSPGMQTILKDLDIAANDSQIVEGKRTVVFPSLLFLILSPAKIEVEGNGQTYPEHEGMVFIENPAEGGYTVRAKGLAKGNYTLLIGQLTEKKDVWDRIEGSINSESPASQVDSYTLNFNPSRPVPVQLTRKQLFDELKLLTLMLNNPDALKFISKAQEADQAGHPEQIIAHLRQVEQSLFQLFGTYTSEQKKQVLQIMNIVEKLYSHYQQSKDPHALAAFLNQLKGSQPKIINHLLELKRNGENVQEKAYLVSVIAEKIQLAETALTDKHYSYAEILLNGSHALIQTLPGYSLQTGK